MLICYLMTAFLAFALLKGRPSRAPTSYVILRDGFACLDDSPAEKRSEQEKN